MSSNLEPRMSPVVRIIPEELDDQALHGLGGAAEYLLLLHLGIAPTHCVPRVGLALQTSDTHRRDHRRAKVTSYKRERIAEVAAADGGVATAVVRPWTLTPRKSGL